MKVSKWGRQCRTDLSREKRERGELGEVWGEEEIDYGKGRKNYQRHFDLLQQSLFPLFLSLEKMQHKQQHVAFKHHNNSLGKERGGGPKGFRSLNHAVHNETQIKHTVRMSSAHTMKRRFVKLPIIYVIN